MNHMLSAARTRAAEFAYNTFDFLDARVEGQFPWVVDPAGDKMRRTVFLSPVEAEDGVEMVEFHVQFADADASDACAVFCVTSAGNHYGHPGDEDFVLRVRHLALGALVAEGQRQGLYV